MNTLEYIDGLWESLGESYKNWYWVDNKWKIYKQK